MTRLFLFVLVIRSSVRQVSVYDPKDMSGPIGKVDLDTSPAILVPHYDEDSSTLFVTGRVSKMHHNILLLIIILFTIINVLQDLWDSKDPTTFSSCATGLQKKMSLLCFSNIVTGQSLPVL